MLYCVVCCLYYAILCYIIIWYYLRLDPKLLRICHLVYRCLLQSGTATVAKDGRDSDTANLRTNIEDFRGFDSGIIWILRGGIPRPTGNFLESLSQAMLVGVMLVGRLCVEQREHKDLIFRIWKSLLPAVCSYMPFGWLQRFGAIPVMWLPVVWIPYIIYDALGAHCTCLWQREAERERETLVYLSISLCTPLSPHYTHLNTGVCPSITRCISEKTISSKSPILPDTCWSQYFFYVWKGFA